MKKRQNVDRIMVNTITTGEGKGVANRRHVKLKKWEGSIRPSDYINKT